MTSEVKLTGVRLPQGTLTQLESLRNRTGLSNVQIIVQAIELFNRQNSVPMLSTRAAGLLSGEAGITWRTRCVAGKVPGARKVGTAWQLPAHAVANYKR